MKEADAQLELFDPDDDGLDFDTWFRSLPLEPEPTMSEDLGRGAAYWARQRRRRQHERDGWMAP